MRLLFILLLTASFGFLANAQTDSTSVGKTYTHRDSVYLTKLNTSGNLMITGGVGLCAVGSYLIYQGNKVYTTRVSSSSPTWAEDVKRNHKQGTIYYVAGGVGIAAGIVLTAFGARNKVDFKTRKKMMELQSGILDNGHIGLALNF